MSKILAYSLIGCLALFNAVMLNALLDLHMPDLACTYPLSPAEIATDQKD